MKSSCRERAGRGMREMGRARIMGAEASGKQLGGEGDNLRKDTFFDS